MIMAVIAAVTGGRRCLLLVLGLLMALPVAAVERSAPSERELALTIYRQGAALVQDRRELEDSGRQHYQLIWPGVAPSLQQDSVRLEGGAHDLRGYRLQHQPIAMAALLEASVDRQVGIEYSSSRGRAVTEATLVSVDPPLASVDGELRSVDPATLVFPAGLPSRFGDAPALELELGPATGGSGNAETVTVDYLAAGFAWSADYVATIPADGSVLDLSARATIVNDSGMDVAEARVELVAGQPAFPEAARAPRRGAVAFEAADMARASRSPEPLGDLQRYTLDASATIADGERYSRRLFVRRGIPVERSYILRPAAGSASGDAGPGWRPVPLTTELAWTSRGSLPAGIVRIYREGEDGRARFVGGDHVQDRPAGLPVTIEPGRPFDVTARRRQTDHQRLDERAQVVGHAFELHNGGASVAVVRVEERIPGDWRMTEASEAWERAAAGLAVWRLELAPGETRELRYRAHIER